MGRAYLRCESECGPARHWLKKPVACIANRLTAAAVARATAIVRSQTGKPFEQRVRAPRGKKAVAASQ